MPAVVFSAGTADLNIETGVLGNIVVGSLADVLPKMEVVATARVVLGLLLDRELLVKSFLIFASTVNRLAGGGVIAASSLVVLMLVLGFGELSANVAVAAAAGKLDRNANGVPVAAAAAGLPKPKRQQVLSMKQTHFE